MLQMKIMDMIDIGDGLKHCDRLDTTNWWHWCTVVSCTFCLLLIIFTFWQNEYMYNFVDICSKRYYIQAH